MSVFVLAIAPTALAKIITVDDDGPADFDNIQAAINAADNGDTVIVADGIYTGAGNRDIYFLGKAITVRSIDPLDPNVVKQTVIDCRANNLNRHRGFYFRHGEMSDSVLAGFTITKGYQLVGGGMYFDHSSPTIYRCTITGNTAKNHAGGIRIHGGSPTISHCTIKGNKVISPYNKGAGIHCAGTPLITHCVIRNNSAAYASGVYCSSGNPTLSNCIIRSNWVAHRGGGVYCDTSTNIINCTIVKNTSNINGDGIYCKQGASIIRNCIIWGNDGPEVAGSGFDLIYSNIQGGWIGEGNIDTDPCFVNTTVGNYHLLPNSVCIDAGDPNYAYDPNDWDIDGQPRVIGGRVDIGADEYHGNNAAPVADAGEDQVAFAWIDGIAEVILDGTGSYDDDGHLLTYLWSWTIDGNDYDASGPTPSIELPVGEHIIKLIVNDRVEDSEPDEVVITVVPPIEVAIKFTPQALNLNSRGKSVKAHFVLPEGFSVEDVDVNSPAEIWQLGIESDYVNVFINEDNLVEIETAFDRTAFCSNGSFNGTVTVVGLLTSGRYFYGSDVIKVTNRAFEALGFLVSYWLQTDCDKPHWCDGADVNQDSVVNFLDFALLDGCCFEVVRK